MTACRSGLIGGCSGGGSEAVLSPETVFFGAFSSILCCKSLCLQGSDAGKVAARLAGGKVGSIGNELRTAPRCRLIAVGWAFEYAQPSQLLPPGAVSRSGYIQETQQRRGAGQKAFVATAVSGGLRLGSTPEVLGEPGK